MTFLQPFILWGLPLIMLPVIIHLLNRMRHRPQPWAAMRFLVSATRSSVNNAKLRQWLILLCRVLAVLALILFLSRPLAGGWLGWALSPAPDAILILLDRSTSMEARGAGMGATKREQALQALAQAAKQFEDNSHLILIDSALRAPLDIGRAANLKDLALAAPTDTAADLPALLSSALNWLIENRAGTAELWIASDLQRSNWQPEDARWQSLVAQLSALPQKIRVRLLGLNQSTEENRSVSLKEVVRRSRGDRSELQFVLDVQQSSPRVETVPLTLNLDGTKTQSELKLESQSLRWRHQVNLRQASGTGWGSFELPSDGNSRDNVTYFAYGPEAALRATIVNAESRSARLVSLAVNASVKAAAAVADVVPASGLGPTTWEDNTLIVWMEALPSGALAQKVRAFVEEGGTVLFLPPERSDPQRFEGVGWGEVQSTTVDKPWRILRWEQEEGPLAKSDEGLSLPLRQTQFWRHQAIIGPKNVLAAFEDGSPFLSRQNLGRGEIFFCASRPDAEWSSLGEGPVLVPMIQRMLQSGSRRLQQALSIACGDLSAVDQTRRWETVDSATAKDIRTQAGVYRSGERLLAVNVPSTEETPEILEESQARQLFGSMPLQVLQERPGRTSNMQGEVWRLFVSGMLLLLVVEGILMLPARPRPGGTPSGLKSAGLRPGAEVAT